MKERMAERMKERMKENKVSLNNREVYRYVWRNKDSNNVIEKLRKVTLNEKDINKNN